MDIMTQEEARKISSGVAAGILRGWGFRVDPEDHPSAYERILIEGEFQGLIRWLDRVAAGDAGKSSPRRPSWKPARSQKSFEFSRS